MTQEPKSTIVEQQFAIPAFLQPRKKTLKQLSDETKAEIHKLATHMVVLTARACEETGAVTNEDASLVSIMLATEFQAELIRVLQSEGSP